MLSKENNYFVFVDESGTLISDRFFGLGILIIQNTGELYRIIKKHYDIIKELSNKVKQDKIKKYTSEKDIENLTGLLKSNIKFELGFKHVQRLNCSKYKNLIDDYFNINESRYCTMVIDRKHPDFKYSLFDGRWDMYVGFLAAGLVGNFKNISDASFCIICDENSTDASGNTCFEEMLRTKLLKRLGKEIYNKTIFNILRLESHSCLMLQMVDVFLGAVLYEFRKENGIVSPHDAKDAVSSYIMEKIGVNKLTLNFTKNDPSYFSTWKLRLK